MKVFISWSGKLSHRVALLLKEWLEDVIQTIEAYVSSEDVDKGARWLSDISIELEHTDFGIICLTPENIEAPWILFEAGALSKSIDKSRVCPLLIGLTKNDIVGPLLQFQACSPKKKDMLKLLKTINNESDKKPLEDTKLIKSFDRCWPEFEKNLEKAQTTISIPEKIERPTEDMIDEILQLCRSISTTVQNPAGQRLTQADINFFKERKAQQHFGPFHYYLTIKPVKDDVLNEFSREINDSNIVRGLKWENDNDNILIDVKTMEQINPGFLIRTAQELGMIILDVREGFGM